MITVALIASILAAPPMVPRDPRGTYSADGRQVRFVIDPKHAVYKVGLNFNFQTTVRTPTRCSLPAFGSTDFTAAVPPDDTTGRRFMISPAVEQRADGSSAIGTQSNISFDCEGGLEFTIEVVHVPLEEAVLLIEFRLSEDESARVRAAIDAERARCAEEMEATSLDLRAALETEIHDAFVKGLLRRYVASDDAEAARENFVIVKTTQQLLVGERGYIVFSVQNRTSKEVVVKNVDVVDGESGGAMMGVSLVMPQKRIAPDSTQFGVAVFEATEEASTFTLVVYEDGPRVIRVSDIEL